MTHNGVNSAAITISGRSARILIRGSSFCRRPFFLGQRLGIESVLKGVYKRPKAAFNHSARVFVGAVMVKSCWQSTPASPAIQEISRNQPRIRPLPNTADIT